MKNFTLLLPLIFASVASAQTAPQPSPAPQSEIRPGDGFPGKISAYKVTPDLKPYLDRFGLTAGWFHRDSISDVPNVIMRHRLVSNEIPYLLYTPKVSPQQQKQAVPMVMYFGGTGEHGTNLVEQFHQTTIFDKITSAEFQKKHPCYIFAPMVPKQTQFLNTAPKRSMPMTDLVCDAMYAVIRNANNPPVDTNRIYLTGLSFGGSASFMFPSSHPGRFAASVPVASWHPVFLVPKKDPGNYWLLYNEEEFNIEVVQEIIADFAKTVNERGGEFRKSTFPDKGHNAWDKAWREDVVWDWMFSKTADGKPVKTDSPALLTSSAAKPVGDWARSASTVFLEGAVCTASKPGRDEGSGPERVADNLEATSFVADMKRGDWWQIEFAETVTGRIAVLSGYRDGKNPLTFARVETSADGKRWDKRGMFPKSGEFRMEQKTPMKFLRVYPESATIETVVLRKIEVQK